MTPSFSGEPIGDRRCRSPIGSPLNKSQTMITGTHHTSCTVARLEASVEFFRDVLGCELLYVREIRDDYFGRIVGFPGCVVKAALFKLPGKTHHLELFEYVEPRGTQHTP